MKHLLLFFFCISMSLFAVPPRQIPEELVDQYTLDGLIPVMHTYYDHSYPPTKPVQYRTKDINKLMQKCRLKRTLYYGATDTWLYQALEHPHYTIQGKEVAIIGSVIPWYESIVLCYQGVPHTIEYNAIESNDPRLHIYTVDSFEKNPRQFDAVLSISSIEHDGLGRYGDPLNPFGDIEAMKKTKAMLQPGGLLFLAVPVGPDCLVWNAHRIYGPARLPMLLEGWELLDSYGFDESLFNMKVGFHEVQPVFVLRKVEE